MWNLREEKPLQQLISEHHDWVTGTAESGMVLLTGSRDKTIRMYDIPERGSAAGPFTEANADEMDASGGDGGGQIKRLARG